MTTIKDAQAGRCQAAWQTGNEHGWRDAAGMMEKR
jgi:hypothetical protein